MIPAKDPRYAFHANFFELTEALLKKSLFFGPEMQAQKEKTLTKTSEKMMNPRKISISEQPTLACEPDAIAAVINGFGSSSFRLKDLKVTLF